MTEALKIRRRIAFQEVPWPGVLETLTKRFSLPFEEAYAGLDSFLKRVKSTVNLYWYVKRKLSAGDNRIAVAICECLGADIVTVTLHKRVVTPVFEIDFQQELELAPRFNRAAAGDGACRPLIFLRLGKRNFKLDGLGKALCFYGLAFMLGVASYVAVVGLLLYGIAIFMLFLSKPLHVTMAATRSVPLGLGLLAFLVASAAIFGKAVRNVLGLLMKSRSASAAKDRAGSK